MKKIILSILISCVTVFAFSQNIGGTVVDEYNESIPHVFIKNISNNQQVLTDLNGSFKIKAGLADSVIFRFSNYATDTLIIGEKSIEKNIEVKLTVEAKELATADVVRKRLENFDIGNLPPIKGVQITTGTNAVIEMQNLSGAKSSGNPREMFAKIPGLNIWESDGAGIQIGIGGRGLSPNRAANFNTRQNGHDISADALGYPESYYTPPFEALKSIEITRGSASLQFGTQFGGLLNFVVKDAAYDTPLEITTRNTVGAYGYLGTFNRITGSNNKFSYQVYHQYKKGNGYRENSNFDQQQLFAQVGYYLKDNIQLRLEYTHMNYLTQQAGGLTDLQFEQDPRQSIRNRNHFKVDWNMLALHFDYDITRSSTFNIRAFGMKSSRESLGFLGKITQADPLTERTMIQGLFENGGIESRFLQKYHFNKKNKDRFTRGAFLVGMRYYQGSSVANQGNASDGEDADFRFMTPDNLDNSSYSFPSKNIAAFAENILFLNPKLTANFGVRYENIVSSSEGFYKRYSTHPFTQDTLAIYTIQDTNTVKRSLPLFGAGLSYKTGKQSSVYVNFTQNYRAINFTDIRVSNPNIIIDSLIQDEYGYTGEIGFRGLHKKYITFDLALFYIFYGDKIGIAPKQGTIYKERTNIGNAINTGVESFVEVDLLQMISDSARNHLNVFVNAAYIDARYIKSKEANYLNKNVEYVSPFIFKTGLKFKTDKFSVQFQLSHNAKQFSDASNSIIPSGDALIGEVPAYTVLDLSSQYTFNNSFKLEAGINNLTNQQYFTRRALSYPGPGIIPSDGISFYFTLQYQFKVKKK
jgi:Fe(3+) dicitrate transport protein